MISIGASCPVQSSNERAPWWTSIGSPSRHRDPARPRLNQQRSVPVGQVRDQPVRVDGVEQSGARTVWSSFQPIEVALTITEWSRIAPIRSQSAIGITAAPSTWRSRQHVRCALRRRLATVIPATPISATAATTARGRAACPNDQDTDPARHPAARSAASA